MLLISLLSGLLCSLPSLFNITVITLLFGEKGSLKGARLTNREEEKELKEALVQVSNKDRRQT